jgi:hypothetical protein
MPFEASSHGGSIHRHWSRSVNRSFTNRTRAGNMTDIPELREEQFARAIPARVRRRLVRGQFESGDDVAALRRFVGLSLARRNSPRPWGLVCTRFEIGSRVAGSQRVRPLRSYGLLPDTRGSFAKILNRRPERSNKTSQLSSRARRQLALGRKLLSLA